MKAFERKSGLSGPDIGDSDECAPVMKLIGWCSGVSPLSIRWMATRDESDAIEWLRLWPPERAS
jgi:hypothetical protein